MGQGLERHAEQANTIVAPLFFGYLGRAQERLPGRTGRYGAHPGCGTGMTRAAA